MSNLKLVIISLGSGSKTRSGMILPDPIPPDKRFSIRIRNTAHKEKKRFTDWGKAVSKGFINMCWAFLMLFTLQRKGKF